MVFILLPNRHGSALDPEAPISRCFARFTHFFMVAVQVNERCCRPELSMITICDSASHPSKEPMID